MIMLASDFSLFVEQVVEQLSYMHKSLKDPRFSRNTSPSDFELLVYEASQEVILQNKLNCCINYTEGGYAFPDLVYTFDDGSNFGIEVKSSISLNSSNDSWVTLGNSILGSTRIDVEDMHLIFIKINKNGCFINYARYEDAISDIVVTHSPRFKINLSQKPNESFFAKSGISYGQLTDSNDPIGLVTNYFKEQGETAWWIAESTPAIIKTWSEISDALKNEILSKAFLIFPELIYSTSSNKYKNLAKWLVANYSIVDSSLRDRFTAGGRITIEIDSATFLDMPRVYESFYYSFPLFSKYLMETTLDELQEFWDGYDPKNDSPAARLSYWMEEIESNLSLSNNSDRQLNFIKLLLTKVERP